jgi:hypothetical protein
MTDHHIALIVEGDGETTAMPVLLRRIAGEGLGRWDVAIASPHRRPRGNLVAPGGIERYTDLVAVREPGATAVLVVLDADDDCPADTGPELSARARQARPDLRVSVVLANREFEAWFIAAAPSLRGKRGLRPDLERPADPEQRRDCKGWLTAHRSDGGVYKPTADQAALAAAFDLQMARKHSSSFDKLWRDVERLLREVT